MKHSALVFALASLFLFACNSSRTAKYAVEEKQSRDMQVPMAAPVAELAEEEFEPEVTEEQPIKHNTEEYDKLDDNPFRKVTNSPLSTFSIDVDNASYTNIRRFLNNNSMPPADAVRIEEMINYFTYAYPQPNGEHPFSVNIEMSQAPWHTQNKLVRIGLQGKKLDYENIQPCNLVFLLDVSGSMEADNKLPLLRKALKLLVKQLDDRDKISIVVYASSEGLVLPATPASDKRTIFKALDKLSAGGSTAGGAGIKLAYKVATENLIKGGNNRVILATDGDFNVGSSSTSELVRLIEEKRQSDIYLTILGLGMGNYKDGRMEQISNAGNGNYFYIDNIKEAEKVFVHDMRANMFTIAKDVKIQVEFNPLAVKAYRLIGYINRKLNKEDFNDDKKDAGELGAGHNVTALYEIIPAGSAQQVGSVDELKYQKTKVSKAANGDEIMTVKLRYKPPKEDTSKLIEIPVKANYKSWDESSDDFRFAASVAGFGMLLRESEYKGDLSYDKVLGMAQKSLGEDKMEYRREFVNIIKTAKLLHETEK